MKGHPSGRSAHGPAAIAAGRRRLPLLTSAAQPYNRYPLLEDWGPADVLGRGGPVDDISDAFQRARQLRKAPTGVVDVASPHGSVRGRTLPPRLAAVKPGSGRPAVADRSDQIVTAPALPPGCDGVRRPGRAAGPHHQPPAADRARVQPPIQRSSPSCGPSAFLASRTGCHAPARTWSWPTRPTRPQPTAPTYVTAGSKRASVQDRPGRQPPHTTNATAPSPPATTKSPSATKPPSTSPPSTSGYDFDTRPKPR